MNARIVCISLIALAALGAGLAACGGSSGGDKTKTAAAGTPSAGTTASAGKTTGATSTSKTPGANPTPGANQTAGANQTPGAAATAGTAPDTSSAPPVDVTVNAQGTATNSQGTPVPLPPTPASAGATPGAAATPAPGTTEAAGATAQAAAATPVPGSGPRITIDAPATASGDFSVTVRLDGVAQPYMGFNIDLFFDGAIADSTGSTAGTALANTPDEIFCAKVAEKIPGEEGLGCTILGTGRSTNNGVLATFTFQRKGAGTLRLHMKTSADGGATQGTFLVVDSDPDPNVSNPTPFDVGLTDATVTIS